MKKLGFGTLRLPLICLDDATSIDQDLFNRLVDEFMKAGYTYFETGFAYHSMCAEDACRKAIVERYPRESFCFADKIPTYNLKKGEDLENIFSEQLRRCNVSYFDYYLFHNLGRGLYIRCEELGGFAFLRQKKEAGLVKKIGFSFHDTPELLDEILREHPEVDVVQLQINYLDWDNISVQSRRCYDVARKYLKPVIVMEPVKGGGLASIPPEAERLMREARPADSPASWALRFAAGLEGVFMVLSGMNTLGQVRDNIRTFDTLTPVSPEETAILAQVTGIISKTAAIPCTACRYCTGGCPKDIQIPVLLSIYNETLAYGDITYPRVHYQHAVFGHGKAGDCMECGECEKICPQHLKRSRIMKDIAARFG
jgi:predicted aldo/keto reductase-like oxidoreductase